MGVLPVGASELRTDVLSQLRKRKQKQKQKNGKTKQKWEVLPVGTNVLFPIKKHKIEKK